MQDFSLRLPGIASHVYVGDVIERHPNTNLDVFLTLTSVTHPN